MKYAIIIPDGAADEPQSSLDGQTPLEAARMPAADRLAAAGVVARACHTPASLPAGSEVGNMSLLGYDPLENFTGRAPIEAAAQGIELGKDDWAVRCNLVTIVDQVMRDFTADHISTEEAHQLMAAMQEAAASEGQSGEGQSGEGQSGDGLEFGDALEFVGGVSYRNLMLWRGDRRTAPFSMETQARPPHDLTDQSVTSDFPRGPGSDVLVQLMDVSVERFAEHPVNQKRRAEGRLPATNIWLWGLGRTPTLAPFAELYGPQGAMITAVDLLRGLAALIGWDRIEVPGATGYTDTDYRAKGRAAVEALQEYDLVCVHVEAPDEASHEGDAAAKVKALEEIDEHIIGPVAEALARHDAYRVMISPDHPTFLATKTHTHGDVPVAMAGTGIQSDAATAYHDRSAAASELAFAEGWRAMPWFVQSK